MFPMKQESKRIKHAWVVRTASYIAPISIKEYERIPIYVNTYVMSSTGTCMFYYFMDSYPRGESVPILLTRVESAHRLLGFTQIS